ADLSDARHGFSLLNDCKYGYDAKANVIRLSLLRSPEWPDPHADEGLHEFTYSLYAHGGNWKDALTIRRGYELNYPLLVRRAYPHSGNLPEQHSFLQLQGDNVVLTAAKKAEDGDALVLRFYEWAGKENDISVQPGMALEGAEETDLMERPLHSLPLDGGLAKVHVKPYEIKTLRIKLSGAQRSNFQEKSKP
ncbi:MAG TPA: glycosyl hydrolase-related protein, partial [Candidatus Acidoferrum sp.]|nr:glycosyl hydrolase-related protein [Candidatus Acidoferrum sp.]